MRLELFRWESYIGQSLGVVLLVVAGASLSFQAAQGPGPDLGGLLRLGGATSGPQKSGGADGEMPP